jgi:hypothetical protein
MLIRTPDGVVDVTAVQKRAAEQLKGGVVTDDIKFAVALLATVSEECEAQHNQNEALRETMTY